MPKYSEFDEVTGECVASCGGDSISGHAKDCPIAGFTADLATLSRLLKEGRELMNEYAKQNAELIANAETVLFTIEPNRGDLTKNQRQALDNLRACIAMVKG